jgi:multidrug efflux pump subunit AcrA (membrane-fusion protein)
VSAAEAALTTAKLNLGFTEVRSLVSGVAGQASMQAGNLISPQSVLTSVSQLDPIKVYFSISDALKKQRVAREEQEKLVAAAEDATHLARIRYQGGETSYLEVLATDSSLFTAQLNLVNSREGEAQSLVQLYEALGGGWE